MLIHRRLFQTAARIWMAALLLALTTPAFAQDAGQQPAHDVPTTGLRAELIRDVEQLEQKYLGLAETMRDHYTWRPAEGVRSVSEVLMHIASANLMIPTMAGVQPPEAYRAPSMQEAMAKVQTLEKITDAEQIQEALRTSFAHARHAIASTPDEELDTRTTMFGRDVAKRQVLVLLVNHMHEHLGQSIAYARTNGVTPPWSGD